MNCNKCKNGVMESAGFVRIYLSANGLIRMKHYKKRKNKTHELLICSLDECSHVITAAVPGTLTTFKKLTQR